MKWLSTSLITTSLAQLPHHVVLWLSDFAKTKPQPDWKAFHCSDALSGPAQVEAWQKHASITIPACLGVRTVADLEHVSAKVQLTLRPVQQAKLAWALREYQQQLQDEKQGESAAQRAAEAAHAEFRRQQVHVERAAAQGIVEDVYRDCKKTHDVHGFVEQLSVHYPKLDVKLLPDRTTASIGSVTWHADLLRNVKTAILMAHPDKAGSDVTARHEAFSIEISHALLDWKKLYV